MVIIYKAKDFESINTPEGQMIPIFINENICVIRLNIPSGLSVPAHSHKSNIVAIVMKGKLEINHNDKREIVDEGDVFFIPANIAIGISNPFKNDTEIITVSYPSSYKNIDEFKKILKSLLR